MHGGEAVKKVELGNDAVSIGSIFPRFALVPNRCAEIENSAYRLKQRCLFLGFGFDGLTPFAGCNMPSTKEQYRACSWQRSTP